MLQQLLLRFFIFITLVALLSACSSSEEQPVVDTTDGTQTVVYLEGAQTAAPLHTLGSVTGKIQLSAALLAKAGSNLGTYQKSF